MEDRMRILLCEDDENLGMLLREYLQAKLTTPTSSSTVKADTRLSLKENTTSASLMS